jgi:hypothetical protein
MLMRQKGHLFFHIMAHKPGIFDQIFVFIDLQSLQSGGTSHRMGRIGSTASASQRGGGVPRFFIFMFSSSC